MKIRPIIFLLLITPFCKCQNTNIQARKILKDNLLSNYRNDNIPLHDETLNLTLGIAIRAFNEINQIEGTITMNIWLRYKWVDSRLTWNQSDYNNISKLAFNTHPDINGIWVPDIYLYNTGETPMSELDYSHAVVYNDGGVLWSRPGLIKSTCLFDLSLFPYDTQHCHLKFGSWSYDGNDLRLITAKPDIDISNYRDNEEWSLKNYQSNVNVKYYSCCEEPYYDITFNYSITRKPGYYNMNIILPTFATATLIIMTLFIPWDSGERISFAVTVMLAIVVYLLILSENLPKSDQRPLLSDMIIGLTMFSLIGVFFTILISALNSYEDNDEDDEPSIKVSILKGMCKMCKFFKFCKDEQQNIPGTPTTNIESNLDTNKNETQKETKSIPSPNTLKNNLDEENTLNQITHINRSDSYLQNVLTSEKSVLPKKNPSNKEMYKMNGFLENIYRILYEKTTKKDTQKECKNMSRYIENIYIVLFFLGFILYCFIMFSQVP